MSREHVVVKKICNAKRLVNHYIMLKAKERKIQRELEDIKRSMERTFCGTLNKEEKVLIEGSKENLEIGSIPIKRTITDTKKCFEMLNPVDVFNFISFSVPEIELELSSKNFNSIIESTYGDHRVFRLKKKDQEYEVIPRIQGTL